MSTCWVCAHRDLSDRAQREDVLALCLSRRKAGSGRRRPRDATRLLQHWGDYLLDRSVVLAGETLESGPWLLEGVAVDRPPDTLGVAAALYGDDFRALQLVWATPSGRWPWEPGDRRVRPAGQPLLGTRSRHYCPNHQPGRLDVPPHL